MTSTDQDRWRRVKERLRSELGDDVFTSWFGRMELETAADGVLRLSVPTRFLRNWIQSHYSERVLVRWQEEEPAVTRLELSVRSATIKLPAAKPKAPESLAPARETRDGGATHGNDRAGVPFLTVHEALGGSPLDPRLTFESFIVGRSNTLAHAAAKQVATSRRGEPLMFNPLYTHAAVGLGKTHLLQAITWAGNNGGDRKMLYLTAERFMYGFVSALRTQTTLAFKEVVRAIDVLVIDDLQFLQGRSTQAEFCHTLNTLIDAGRQVIIASDRPPADLESLDDRVRSRLAGGLVVEIGSLGEELRFEILKSRIAAARSHHPGFEVPAPVLAFIAKSVTHNGRDLEGAVNKLLAHSKLTGQPVTLEMAEHEMRDLIRPAEPKRVRIEDIQRIVARQYNVSRADLLSSRRTANVVRPRQVAMYLAKVLTLRSLPEIGRRFGGRDHTTVLHAVRKIENLAGNDSAFAEEIEGLKRQLQD
ncbi:MAG: chromosomal replication initiator protein DnaA [Xanthobacteraceae bacterium]